MDIDSPQRPYPMTDNQTAGNVIEITSSPVQPVLKRKSDERVQHDGKENGDDKRVKLDSTSNGISKPLVDLKGKKLVYKEDAAPWSIPKRRLLRFSTLLLDAEEEGKKLTELPSEYYDLVVMAGHELSSVSENALTKAIRTALCKDQLETLPAELITPLIPKLFSLTHYGLLAGDFPSSSTSSNVKIPAGLQIRRWEAIEPEKYFPAEHLDAVNARKAERRRVREECIRILKGMDDVEAYDLVKGDKEDKKERKTHETKAVERGRVEQSPSVSIPRASREGTAATNDSRRSASPSKKSKVTPEEEEAARIKKEEAEAKKAEKAERKAAREAELKKKEDEKAKLEAGHAKQANMFGSFFKPKSKVVSTSNDKASASASASPNKRESTPEQSDFDQVFKPHVVRPGTRWAPITSWVPGRSQRGEDDIEENIDGLSPKSLLARHLGKHKRKSRSQNKLPPGIKSGSPYGTIGELWSAYQDAVDPRKVLGQMRKQHRYPWKLLAFDQQARPPYSGTFTKRSAVVGPRTPFAQDPMFDYTYDSGDDWEEEEGGDDVDDSGEVKPEEEEEVDSDQEEEDEFDDWLDDTEDGYAPIPVEDENDPLPHAGPSSRQERLPMNVVKKSEKPRKVVKIVPSWKGPIWETEVGKNDTFSEYRIQLLNDTPDSFDPFTYVSNEPAQVYKGITSKVIISALEVPCLHATSISTTTPAPAPLVNTPDTSSQKSALPPKSRPSGPKIGFPVSHLTELFTLIQGNTQIKPVLVAQLHQQFESITTKAAIEAKVKEVAFRQGRTKDSQWKVKPEAWTAAGLAPPVEGLTATSIPAKEPIA